MKSNVALAVAPEPTPAATPAPARLRLYTRAGAAGPEPTPAPPIRGREDAARYIPFVRRIAARLARGLPSHVALDDLVSAGMIGLIDALDRFDPDKGQRFETYAEFRVRGAMLDDLRRADLMARDARLESKRIQRAIAVVTQQLGRPPEEEELAAHLELSVEALRGTLQRLGHVQVFSLEDLSQRDPDAFGGIQSGDDPFEHAMIAEVQHKLTEAIPKLAPRLRMALTLHYYEKLPVKDIAALMGVTESRISQMMSEAVLRLRSMLGLETD
jgi:RNA polymerase sigma factor for flagellar operon FliA